MRLNKLNLIIFISLLLFSFSALANLSLAGPADTVINGFSKTGEAAGFPIDTQQQPKRDFVSAWGTYVTNFAAIMSALFLLLIIYAGWLWMSARGNEDQVANAKKIIIGAVIGLAIIIGGRLIVELALNFLGPTINTTTLPTE